MENENYIKTSTGSQLLVRKVIDSTHIPLVAFER